MDAIASTLACFFCYDSILAFFYFMFFQKPELEESQSAMHPVSRLLHIQQAKKEKEPVFTLVGEHGDNIRPLNRQFTIQVS